MVAQKTPTISGFSGLRVYEILPGAKWLISDWDAGTLLYPTSPTPPTPAASSIGPPSSMITAIMMMRNVNGAVRGHSKRDSSSISRILSPPPTGPVKMGVPLPGILVLTLSSNEKNNSSSSNVSSIAKTKTEDNTPSEQMTVSPSYEWNVDSDGLLTVDLYIYLQCGYWMLPIIYTAWPPHNLTTLLDRSATEEEEYHPSIVSDFNYYMGPSQHEGLTVDSKLCLSWTVSNGE